MTKVLIAEDEADILNLEEKFFSLNGFEVDTAFDGCEALEKIKKSNYDIVITDIGMPIKDGLELCHIIKTTPELSHIKVIIVTAYGNDSAKVLGTWVSADDYICKPVDMGKLLETVNKYVNE